MSERRVRRRKPRLKFDKQMYKKLGILFWIVVLALFALCTRIAYLNVAKGDNYSIKVLEQQSFTSKTIPYKRGDIKDRNGNVLATSVMVYNLIIDSKVVMSNEKYLTPTVNALVKYFDFNEDDLRTAIKERKNNSYWVAKKNLEYKDIQKFESYLNYEYADTKEEETTVQNTKGIWFEKKYKRMYPYNNLACSLLGFANSDNSATIGIESSYNSFLQGTDGREYGYPTNLYTYSSKGASGNGGTPGTDSNDSDTDYVNNSSSGTSNTVDVQKLTDLLTNEKVQNIKQETPAIKLADSSLGIVVRKYTVYKEDDLKADGTLDKTTWDQFISQNNKISTTTVSTDEINLISAATGVSANKITVLAYNVPQFVSSTKSSNGISNYLMIILTVLIIALLIFVILRGASPLAAEDEEPELSVEQLLATTKENQSLDDIEFSDKSETRKMIEKFVDENPEAVAQLLRNWLNDEWE